MSGVDLMQAAAAAVDDADTVRTDLTMTQSTSLGGLQQQTLRVESTGRMSVTDGTADVMMTIEFDGPGIPGVTDEPMRQRMLLVDGVTYTQGLPGMQLEPGRTWLAMDASALGGLDLSGGGSLGQSAQMVELLGDFGGEVRDLGPTRLGDREVRHLEWETSFGGMPVARAALVRRQPD